MNPDPKLTNDHRWFRIHFEIDNLHGDTAEFATSYNEAERQFKRRGPDYLRRLTVLEISEC